MVSHAVEKPAENGNTVFLENATYGTANASATRQKAVAYAHASESQAKAPPAAPVSKRQKATTAHAGALDRKRCCAIVSNTFARISTPATGVEEYGVSQRSFISVCAVSPVNTILPANRWARVGSSRSCLSVTDGTFPSGGTYRMRRVRAAAFVAGIAMSPTSRS